MYKHCTMKELPADLRPYEKFTKYGAVSLTDGELLAIIIRTGAKGIQALELANAVLDLSLEKKGILSLHHLDIADLMTVKGIGKVKAVQISCIAELSNRLSKARAFHNLSFQSPETIAEYYMEEFRHLPTEQFMLVMLNTKNKLIYDKIMSRGTVNSALVSPREIFIEACRYHAVNIIVIHNHPSGDPTPSREDLSITRRLKEAGELIGIRLLDHIIIGDNCYISLKERGIFN